MRGETTPASQQAPQGDVDAILSDLRAAADGECATEVLPPLSRAFAAIRAVFSYPSQLSPEDRYSLAAALFRAEAAAKTVLQPSYFDERGRHGFVAAFGMLKRWAEAPGSDERATACPDEPKVVLILRIVANDLDTLCAADALGRLGPSIRPADVLLSSEMLSPLPAPAGPVH